MGWSLASTQNNGRRSEVETFGGDALPAPFATSGANTNSTGVVKTEIDSANSATTVTDQAGKLRRSITNSIGWLTRVDEPNASNQLGTVASPNQATYYDYNSLGNMVHVQQGVQHRYFMHDSLGRLVRVRQPEQVVNSALNTTGNPDNNSWTIGFTHDNNGNVLASRDANNVVITRTYDALNRQLTRSYSDSTPTVTYTYDDSQVPFSKGKLTKISSSVSEMRYTEYDEAGRPVASAQATDGEVYSSSYKYNLAGVLVEQTYPSGRVVQNVLDISGDISIIRSRKNQSSGYWNYAQSFQYTASGVIEHLRLGNGLWESAVMNSRNQVLQLRMGNNSTDASRMHLTFDYGEVDQNGNVDATKNAGNIVRQTIDFDGLTHPFIQKYLYDSLDRITEAKETVNGTQTWIQNFGYDRYGNRTSHSQTVLGQAKTINETTLPSIDAYTNRFSSTTDYDFDAVGNLIRDAQGREFTFNGDNKQVEVKDYQDVMVGEYVYDGLGKRIKRVTSSETTVFVYDGLGKLIEEYSTATPPQNPMVSYTATDPLGSPRVLTNENGNIVSRRDFMPFGEELAADTTYRTSNLKYGIGDNVRQKFTGYQRDEETSLDFAEARYYYNNHARFTAVDPLLASGKSANPQTFNRYAYGLGRPMVLNDPTGLQVGRPAPAPAQPTPQQIAEQANRAMGNLEGRDLRRFNEARDNALRMVAAPTRAGEINACREALITNFGNADPTAALQRLQPTGGAVVVDQNNQIVPGPQNVFDGTNSQAVISASGAPVETVENFFDNHPTVSAIANATDGNLYVDDSFNSGRSDLGRAQDLIHETVVHQANNRRDAEFAPAADQAIRQGESEAQRAERLRTAGSRRVNEIIRENCNTIPQPQ
jgi:RHS repeat-associated protein